MTFLVSLYEFFILVPSPEFEWNILCFFLLTRSLRIFRVQYFDDLSAIWLSTVYSHFRGCRARSFIFCCFISWLNCKIKMKHIYMHNLSDECSKKSPMILMNTTENKSMYKNRKFCPEQYFTGYWFSRLKVYWKNPS